MCKYYDWLLTMTSPPPHKRSLLFGVHVHVYQFLIVVACIIGLIVQLNQVQSEHFLQQNTTLTVSIEEHKSLA